MYLERLWEGIPIDLYGFDLSKVIFDIDEILVAHDRNKKLLIVLKQAVAEEGSGGCLLGRKHQKIYLIINILLLINNLYHQIQMILI